MSDFITIPDVPTEVRDLHAEAVELSRLRTENEAPRTAHEDAWFEKARAQGFSEVAAYAIVRDATAQVHIERGMALLADREKQQAERRQTMNWVLSASKTHRENLVKAVSK